MIHELEYLKTELLNYLQNSLEAKDINMTYNSGEYVAIITYAKRKEVLDKFDYATRHIINNYQFKVPTTDKMSFMTTLGPVNIKFGPVSRDGNDILKDMLNG